METHMHNIYSSGESRVTSRDTWMPDWLTPSVAAVEEPVEADSIVADLPQFEPPIAADSIPKNISELEPPDNCAEVAPPIIARRRRISQDWQSWTQHRDGEPWRIIQARGELVVPWRDDDDQHTPKPGICRCGSAETRDTSIHDGRTLRRDCANCGRFVAFPLWYGIQQ